MATYTDIEIIGSGGFGEVWKCKRDEDGKILAKKKLINTSGKDYQRFKKEVCIHSELEHPNIIKIYDVNYNDVKPFYIMPCYAYSLFADEATQNIVGRKVRVREVFNDILNALEYAHSKEMIHRDIKPENVLIDLQGNAVISDFGIGRRIETNTTRLTTTGEVLGTFPYIAPEQLMSLKNTDQRTDIYSLGVLLYFLYTGSDRIIRPDKRMPSGMFDVILKCTERDPENRYKDAEELKNIWKDTLDESIKEVRDKRQPPRITHIGRKKGRKKVIVPIDL